MKLRYIFIPAAPLAIIPFWFLLRGPGEVEDERIPSGEPEKRTVETMGPVAAAEPSSSPPDVIIQPRIVRESSPESRLRAQPDTSTEKAKATALERNIPDTTGPAGVEKEKSRKANPW